MAANGTNLDWLRKSCDTSTCDLSPDGNQEKYGRPMKSAILKDSMPTLHGKDMNLLPFTFKLKQDLVLGTQSSS